jgi:hypothetical protein
MDRIGRLSRGGMRLQTDSSAPTKLPESLELM